MVQPHIFKYFINLSKLRGDNIANSVCMFRRFFFFTTLKIKV